MHTRGVYNNSIMDTTTIHKRINITLPQNTVRLLEKTVKKGGRSNFLNRAIKFYIGEVGRSNLKKLLKERALARQEDDLRLAEEWFNLENEAWSKIDR